MRWWFRQQLYTQILASLWPVVDNAHTTCNVSGDLCGTTIIASRLKMMDVTVFNDGRTLESPSTTREHPDTTI
mgnify:CR=1 FL=1